MNPKQMLFGALRTSEFWVALAMAIVEVTSAPVPTTQKVVGALYIVFRVVSKVVGFIFPNPDNPNGGWLKKD